MKKKCLICKEKKLFSYFRLVEVGRQWYRNKCRKCEYSVRKEYFKKYFKEHPKKKKEKSNRPVGRPKKKKEKKIIPFPPEFKLCIYIPY